MNIPIAIPAHVGEDGIWIEFISPATGKQCAINFHTLIRGTDGPIFESMNEWAQAQIATHRVHNPKPASPDAPR